MTQTTPLSALTDDVVTSSVETIDERQVVSVRIQGGKHHGAISAAGGKSGATAVALAANLGIPLITYLDTSGAEISEGVHALHGWGEIARALTNASGVIPTIAIVIGPCVSGPALLLGLFDVVVMTEDAFSYVSDPTAIHNFTGFTVNRLELGGSGIHATRTGVASYIAPTEQDALDWVTHLLDYLPSNNVDDPPFYTPDDEIDRDAHKAVNTMPEQESAAYDVRDVISDVMDADSFFELRANHAPNIVTALAQLGGRTVGIIANQPLQRAGTIDILASQKAARFVQWCDAFNIPLVTFVDTPGFEPGKDLEWRGMIRHGAELVHAYAAATVPRLCIVLRKAYGGAYIVMDSKGLGNDWCAAWPQAEIAVMGASGAVQILHRKQLAGIPDETERLATQSSLIEDYKARFSNPDQAAHLGYVDAVINPIDTRRALGTALDQLATKRETQPHRKHANTPL